MPFVMDDDIEDELLDLAPLLNTNPMKRHDVKRPTSRSSYVAKNAPVMIILLCALFMIFILLYRCSNDGCMPLKSMAFRQYIESASNVPKSKLPFVHFVTYNDIQHEHFTFDMNSTDVMVFLHIQKTGGTSFGKHLVDIDLENPCRCRKRKKKKKQRQHIRLKRKQMDCDCFRPGSSKAKNWLFSRYSTGWKCGVHADWTELTSCVEDYLNEEDGHVPDRRYFYITFLRDPVDRYLSEFRHVQRGATWKTSMHMCNGRPPTEKELPNCYIGEDWSDVSLQEFMQCQSNLAANRQTMMLADLTLVNCYNSSSLQQEEREKILLQSAKDNLMKVAYFGLTEKQIESQLIFEETFNLKFNLDFVQYDEDLGDKTKETLNQSTLENVKKVNNLDIQLYQFAVNLMLKRVEELKSEDEEFERNLTEAEKEE